MAILVGMRDDERSKGEWRSQLLINHYLQDQETDLEQKAYFVRTEFFIVGAGDVVVMDALSDMQFAAEDKDVQAFDKALDVIYEWADRERVWLGA